jgi:hypothetical protein
MITYQELVNYLKSNRLYRVSFRPKYLVIVIPSSQYHITIFIDQWDSYQQIMHKPYHMFHISSDKEEGRCSSYFWIDKTSNRIRNIPLEYFQYEQPSYGFSSSTRKSCNMSEIKFILKFFQKILNRIVEKKIEI